MSGEEFETPAAAVDADRLESNLARWQEYCNLHGLANRPHVKTHRLHRDQRGGGWLGAVGITCQKLSEAETMADAGCSDILVAFNIVGASKLQRLHRLLQRVALAVSVDDAKLLPGLGEAATGGSRELGVLVDCDTGLGQTGGAGAGGSRRPRCRRRPAGRTALRRLPHVPRARDGSSASSRRPSTALGHAVFSQRSFRRDALDLGERQAPARR